MSILSHVDHSHTPVCNEEPMSTPRLGIFPVANDENLDKAPSSEPVLCDNSQLTGMLPIFSDVTGQADEPSS